uniref:Uncharacterized protein n=1 Tax=Oryza glumipatula TaxID=40148 RepID=A0A0E0BTV0_9ORYZ
MRERIGEELRERAERILTYFASDIRLSKLAGGIESTSSTLELHDDAAPYEGSMLVGLRLLWSLAIDMDNCRVMSNTEAMEGILECNECQPAVRELAVKILTQLAAMDDASSSFSAGSRDKLAKSLLGIFTDRNKDSSIRKPAGQALAMLSAKRESNAVVILQQLNGNVVSVLKEMLLNSEENESRISAAEILSRLLHSRYTRDDEYLAEELNKVIMDVMPEVLKEMLQCGATEREIQTGAEADHKGSFSPPGTIDVEVQDDGNRQNNFTSSRQRNSGQYVDADLLAAVLSLTATIFEVSKVQDLVQLVDAVAPVDAGKLAEMLQRNIVVRKGFSWVDWLRILKPTTKMVISMMRHRDSSLANDDDKDMESLINCLGRHSTIMDDLDCSINIADCDHGAKPQFKPLSFLVKEAQELWDKKKGQASSVEGNQQIA